MRALLILAALLVSPLGVTADAVWMHTHVYDWFHRPLPGYEERLHPERHA